MRLDAETRELFLVSYHEAGHAAAHLELDLPLHDARIWVRRRWFGGPQGGGSVRLTPRGGDNITKVGAYILACLAGPEAEARLICQLDGEPLTRARGWAYDYSRGGDLDMVAELIDGGTPFTFADAQAEAGDLVGGIWPSIQSIAAALRETGQLTAKQVRRAA